MVCAPGCCTKAPGLNTVQHPTLGPAQDNPGAGKTQCRFYSSAAGIFYFFIFIYFLKLFLPWAGPRPHIPFPPDLILYVNLVTMGPVHLSPVTCPQALRYWYSLTPLMHIVTQLCPIDLHNFLGQHQREVSFWVPVNYTSLNELVSMPGL